MTVEDRELGEGTRPVARYQGGAHAAEVVRPDAGPDGAEPRASTRPRARDAAVHDLSPTATGSAREEDHTLAVRRVRAFACRLCVDAGSDSRPAMDAHIRGTHLHELRPRITASARIARAFDEQHAERLPSKVHKCTLCTAYYPADDWRAKDSQSVKHMYECPELDGRTSAPFEIISDIDKIRAVSVARRAGGAFGCRWCAERVTFGERAASAHIFGAHRRLLYDADGSAIR